MCMLVYLMQPTNLPCATKMLKYVEVNRDLAQEGVDWRSYDQVFRSSAVTGGVGMGLDQLRAMAEGISN